MNITLAPEIDLRPLQAMLAQRFGLQCDEATLVRLADLVRGRMAATGVQRLDDYMTSLDSEATARVELSQMVEELVPAESFFFRGREQLDALVEICERLLESPGQVRILSAGCAAGEEPYSMAMALCERIPHLTSRIDILGVDAVQPLVKSAERGRYRRWSLRDVEPETVRRWFERDGDEYVVHPQVRQLVRFEVRNLLDDSADFWAPAAFDVIFCRNVLIYFTPEAVRAAVERMELALSGRGSLFLGHAESIHAIFAGLRTVKGHGISYYRHGGGVDGPAQDPARGARPAALPPVPPAVFPRAGASAAAPKSLPPVDHFVELMRRERYADAASLLRACRDEDVPAPGRSICLAAVLAGAGDVTSAERLARESLDGDDFDPDAHYLLALCAEHANDLAAARRHAESAAYLDSTFAMPHVLLARLARREGRLDTARRELRFARALLVAEREMRVVLYGGGFDRNALRKHCGEE